MKSIIVVVLVGWVMAQKRKKCKNGVECYLDAIKTMDEDTEFIKSRLGNGASVAKMAQHVKEEMQEYTRQQSESRLHRMQEMVEKATDDLMVLGNNTAELRDRMDKYQGQQEEQVRKIIHTQENMTEEINQEVQEQHITLEEVHRQTQEQEQVQSVLRKNQEDEERSMQQQVKEVQQERTEQLEVQTKRVEEDTKDNEQIREFKEQITQLMDQLWRVKRHDEILSQAHAGLVQREAKLSHRVGSVAKAAKAKEDYTKTKMKNILKSLGEMDQGIEKERAEYERLMGQAYDLNKTYIEKHQKNHDKFTKTLVELIGRNELVAELEAVKGYFKKVNGMQEQMMVNLTDTRVNADKFEGEHNRQKDQMIELQNKAQLYEELIRNQVTEEIKSIREMIGGVVQLLDKQHVQQSRAEQRQNDTETKFKNRNKRYDFFLNDTKAQSKNVTMKIEVGHHIEKLKDKLQEVKGRHDDLEGKHKSGQDKANQIDLLQQQIGQSIQAMQADQSTLEAEFMRSSKAKLKNLKEQLEMLQQSYQAVSVERDSAQQSLDVILIELERLKKRISDLLDDNPEMTEKQFENLSRKEVSLQLKMVTESLNKIKKSHDEINAQHKAIRNSQSENHKVIEQHDKDIKKAQDKRKGQKRRMKKRGTGRKIKGGTGRRIRGGTGRRMKRAQGRRMKSRHGQ